MESKEMENNIFAAVVSEPNVENKSDAVLVVKVVVLVVPVIENGLEGSGLNQ